MATKIPEIKSFKPIRFPAYTRTLLDNGIPVYQLISSDYEVMKMEINFRAGRLFETQKSVSRACANLLREGTKNHNSEFLAEIFDYYGASFQSNGGMDFARVELYSINRFFPTLLPYVRDSLLHAEFSEQEINTYKQINKQRLGIDLSKNDVLAYRELTESLFGKNHPYGYNTDIDSLDLIDRSSLKNHFNQKIKNSVPSVILAGGIDDKILNSLNDSIGRLKLEVPSTPEFISPENEVKTRWMEGAQKYQATIRMGRKLFPRTNSDYPGIYLLNAVLGGYFGSRLMQNIREEKGLTYDIFSTLDIMWHDGHMMIGADVDNANTELVIDEIRKEMEKLRETPIEKDELQLVKNYINGNLLNLMNGPFNSVELLRLIAVLGYDLTFFDYFMNQLHEIDSEHLLILANKYLDPKDFDVVVVGKKV